MIDILITGSIVYTGERLVRDGYVYIRDGKVEHVGEAPVLEDYSYATLLLGGPGRIVVPGLTAMANTAAYPLRFRGASMAERVNYYRGLDVKTLVTLSLPAVYELHMSGVTTIIVEGLSPELPLSLSEAVGGFYGLAVPVCSGVEPRYVPGLASALRISGPGCEGEADVVEVDGRGFKGSRRVLGLFRGASLLLTASGVEDPLGESLELRKAAMLPPPVIKQGRIAEIAVFDVSRPPAMMLDTASEKEILRVYSSGARLESLIAGEDVLVDTGEHLYIVERSFKEARSLSEKVLKKLG
ncbi:MAG: hypothetical protein P3X22_003450 [Thermoprotei archaeon]|nr:hypothetical protein [Thermoprotei archaeon]